jgi:hypothetical protein
MPKEREIKGRREELSDHYCKRPISGVIAAVVQI